MSAQPKPNGNWFHDHLLSITLFTLFFLSWIGQLVFQYEHEIDQAHEHGSQAPEFWSGDFWASFLTSTFENWQSEFLQLFSMVVFTSFLLHVGSSESRDSDDRLEEKVDQILARLGGE